MNERIRELAEQAKVDAGTLFAEMLCNDSEVNEKIAEAWNSQPQEVRTRIFQTIEQNQKKFAELIVRECLASITSDGHRGDFGRAVEFCQQQIKQHFGVEYPSKLTGLWTLVLYYGYRETKEARDEQDEYLEDIRRISMFIQ